MWRFVERATAPPSVTESAMLRPVIRFSERHVYSDKWSGPTHVIIRYHQKFEFLAACKRTDYQLDLLHALLTLDLSTQLEILCCLLRKWRTLASKAVLSGDNSSGSSASSAPLVCVASVSAASRGKLAGGKLAGESAETEATQTSGVELAELAEPS